MTVLCAFFLLLASVSSGLPYHYFASADGHRIAYTVQGSGPAMLAIPGGPGIDGTYLRQALRGVNARVYVIDPRGTGASRVPETPQAITTENMLSDFERLREQLHLRSWIVFGHSFGGFLAQAYAARDGSAVRGLILASATPPDLRVMGSMQRSVSDLLNDADKAKLRSLGMLARSNPDEAMREQTDLIMPYLFADRSKWRQIEPLIDPPHYNYAMLRAFEANLTREPYAGNLHTFTRPVLVLYGEKDAGVNVFSKDVLDNTRTGRLAILKDAGHFIWVEQPSLFDRLINAFIARL